MYELVLLNSVSALALFQTFVSLYKMIYSIICHVGRCFSVMLLVLFGVVDCIKVSGWMGVLNSVEIVAVSQVWNVGFCGKSQYCVYLGSGKWLKVNTSC